MVPLKRRKVAGPPAGNTGAGGERDAGSIQFPEVVLFLLERKMGASRRTFLSQLGRKKGFHVEDVFNEHVTHVVSENNSREEVKRWLDTQNDHKSVHLLAISWFTDSMRAGRPVNILDRHKLQDERTHEDEVALFSVPSYACQRRTPLTNHNTALTDALSLLAENAELSEEEGRGVAFRRAIAVLKVLPEAVTSLTQLRGLPCLGEHTLRVIKDVLENGTSSEAEAAKNSQRFKALKVLTGIFGVGTKTAERWIRLGINNLQQLKESGQTLNRAQQAGLEHYLDLNQPVTRLEANAISKVIEGAVVSVLPGAQVTLIGGFRRGKPTGHDVDFLITHPEEGKEVGLLPKVVSWLHSKGFLLYQKTTRNSYLESEDRPAQPSSNMDRFERCFSIFKLDTTEGTRAREPSEESSGEAPGPPESEPASTSLSVTDREQNQEAKPWRAVRVDLVVSPFSQFAFALLGWTGSKLFERELRRWAGHEKAMSLNSHALYDGNQRKYLRATSEEEIFSHLGLEFIPPSERNA